MSKTILSFIILVIGIENCDYHNSNTSGPGIPETETLSESVEFVPSDSLPNMYLSVIDEYSVESKGTSHSEYFLYDISGDSIPELWVSSGSCDADTQLTIYTNENGKTRQIYNGDGGHSDYFVFNGELVCVMCNTGSGAVITYQYDKGRIVDKAIEFSMWNDEKAMSDDGRTNKILEYWENNCDKYINLKSID